LPLIVAPASAARLWTNRISTMTAVAVLIGAGCGLGGLALSQRYDVAAGGAITLLAAAVFAVALLSTANHVRAGKWKRKRESLLISYHDMVTDPGSGNWHRKRFSCRRTVGIGRDARMATCAYWLTVIGLIGRR
jgi:ABC 3 transport family